MMKKSLLTLLVLFSSIGMVLAQKAISGKVTDGESKEPLPGTTVIIAGTVNGTITDVNGAFSLNYNGGYPIKLKFSNVGYQPQEIELTAAGTTDVVLEPSPTLMGEIMVQGNRVEEKITRAGVTVEKIVSKQLQQLGAFETYTALQSLKGVDLLSQSLGFKSVNLRGFGANNNNRFVQLTDGMDNRSPGLGFGFGSVAGVSDLDIDNIELLPGASSALYGPDALQGLMLTKTKSPFDYQGLSAQVKTGINNVGKSYISAKPYTDLAVRYAIKLNDQFAIKANFQAINGTDFIADNYDDRMTRARAGFFKPDAATSTTTIGYVPNNDPNTNLQYDGVNIYGDDINNGGSLAGAATFHPDLRGKTITRTGYTEYDLIANKGKVFSYRANAAVHYRINDKLEAIAAWYYGNGNLIRTAGFREYFPDYQRHQFKLELRGDEFFIRGYQTRQNAEGYNLGNLATRMLATTKPTATWGNDFNTAYTANGGNIAGARATADNNKLMPGTAAFNDLRDIYINKLNNEVAGTGLNGNGVRLLDNSKMSHVEGMYNFKNFLTDLDKNIEVITGASYRYYEMLTKGTVFPRRRDGSEFTIKEYGWYAQASYKVDIAEDISFKPTVAVRYDKNEYFKGGFTPRVSGVLSLGEHNFRASWQSAFRNPSPNQLLADGNTGEVGGSETAIRAANLYDNPAYTEASVLAYRASVTGGSPNTSLLVKYVPAPESFTTEKIKTWEVGYKALIEKRFFVDAFYYQSEYKDFIAAQNYIQLKNGAQPVDSLRTAGNGTTLQVNFNNFNEIFVRGFGFGIDVPIAAGYSIAANYANQVGRITARDNAGNIRKDAYGVDIVNRKMSNLEVSAVGRNFFISPENRYNITLSNPKVTKELGFSLAYRWTDKTWVEQGTTQGDILLPSWNTVDAAVSYKIPAWRTIVKVGATNLLNNYYAQGYGLAQVGGLYYIALNFDEVLNR
jgi:outer membrane receptor protein involved in Fe transport